MRRIAHGPVMAPPDSDRGVTGDTRLEAPSAALLPAYEAALRTGWSPNNLEDVSGEQLARIEADPAGFIAGYTWEPGQTVTMPDGREVPRLPGQVRWIFDEEGFCGSINLRHQPGTVDLPSHVLGHIGYAIVPWRRRQGVATRALRAMLLLARGAGLPKVMITTSPDNGPSQAVIRAVGGVDAGLRPADALYGEERVFWVDTGLG